MSERAVRRPSRSVAGGVALWLVVSAVCWFRLSSTTRGTIWAEDGLFLSQRRASGPVGALFDPYAGYLHVLPRVLVDLAALGPLPRFAVLDTALCCAVVGLVGVLVFFSAQPVVPGVAARLVLAGVAALVPAGPVEVLGNVANLHSFMLWLAPWLLLARPQRWWQSGVLATAALLATLTEIQAAVFLPLVLLYPRERRRWPVIVCFAAGLVAQVSVTLTSPRPANSGLSPGAADLVKGFLFNVVVPMWHPSVHGPGPVFARHGWGLAMLELAPFLVATGVLLVLVLRSLRRPTADPEPWLGLVVMGVLVIGSLAPFVAGLVLNFQASYAYGSQSPADLADVRPLRYGVVSAMFLLATVVVLADRLRARSGVWIPVSAVLLVAVLVLGVVQFAPDSRRSKGPTWSDGVARAEVECRRSRGVTAVPVSIAPKRQHWQVTLTCADLGQ